MNTYLTTIIAFLAASLMLYLVFGGADFGAGILEGVSNKRFRETQRDLTSRALGPVWEANHIWIILAIVIIFNSFPEIFRVLSTSLHIPLTIMLLGITMRGCSFTFRHYDVPEGSKRELYSWIFFTSSLITSIAQGAIVGALILGRIPAEFQLADIQAASQFSFYQLYVAPWFNPFCLTTGFFLSSLYTLVGSVFLSTEASENPALQRFLLKRVRVIVPLTMLLGAGVFLIGELSGLSLVSRFSESMISLVSMGLATFCVPLLAVSTNHRLYQNLRPETAAWRIWLWIARITSAAILCCVVSGLLGLQFPVVIATSPEPGIGLDLISTAAPLSTQKQLVIALICGSAFIFPTLAYLLKVFKSLKL